MQWPDGNYECVKVYESDASKYMAVVAHSHPILLDSHFLSDAIWYGPIRPPL